MKSKKSKIVVRAAVSVCLIGLVILGIYLSRVYEYQKKVKNTDIAEVDLQQVPDGTYIGEYNVDFIYAEVEVTVKNGIMEQILILEHKNGRGAAAEKIIDSIEEEQRIDVDAVSSATNSSTVIKKAVENALKQDENK